MTNKLRWILATLLLSACKSPQGPVPRSPTHDNEPPATSPGDGEVVGADKVPPAQKLEEGPKLDSERGAEPAREPGSDK
jgi:hypothetical protein